MSRSVPAAILIVVPPAAPGPERQRWEVLRVEAHDLELGAAREEIEPAGRARLERHLVRRDLSGDLVELPRVRGHRAGTLHLCGDAAAEPDLHVGGRHADRVAVGLDQHVRQDRLWRAPFHDTLHQVQPVQQVFALDADLHPTPHPTDVRLSPPLKDVLSVVLFKNRRGRRTCGHRGKVH
jgi:hypothetical protein